MGCWALVLDPATKGSWEPTDAVLQGRERKRFAMWMHSWLRGWPDDRSEGRTWQPGQHEVPSGTSVGRPPTTARVLAEIRTRGFYSEVATTLLSGQSWRDLARWWRVSNLALAFEPSVKRKLQWAILRAAILDEMEAEDPERFSGWLGRQRPGRRYRSCR